MHLKRKIRIIITWLIIFLITLMIEHKYLYNKNNQSNIQIQEEYEVKDLANLIGKNKGYVEDVLGGNYENKILTKDARVSVDFDEDTELVSLVTVLFKEDNKSMHKVIYEKLWNELGKSSIKYISSDKNVIEIWNKGDLEINFNKVNDYICLEIS